jgi:hypothetical protein
MYGVHPADFLPKHYLPEETWALTGKSGRPTGLGGTAPTSWPGLGQIWLVSTPAIYEPGNDLLFLRLSSAFIEMCHERYPILFNYVDARQERHLKWLRACGFSAVKLRDPWGRRWLTLLRNGEGPGRGLPPQTLRRTTMCVFAAAAAGAAGAAGGMGAALQIAQVGLGIAGSLMQYQGQMQAYKAQMEYRRQQAIENQKTLNMQVAQSQQQYESELNKTQQEKFKVTRDALKAQSTAAVAGAEQGVSGLSLQNISGEIAFEEGMFTGETGYNERVLYADSMNRLKMNERGQQANLASIPIPERPSFGPTLVNIGTNIVGGLQKAYEPRRGTPGVDFYG